MAGVSVDGLRPGFGRGGRTHTFEVESFGTVEEPESFIIRVGCLEFVGFILLGAVANIGEFAFIAPPEASLGLTVRAETGLREDVIVDPGDALERRMVTEASLDGTDVGVIGLGEIAGGDRTFSLPETAGYLGVRACGFEVIGWARESTPKVLEEVLEDMK